MGVPGLYRNIIKEYPNIHFGAPNENITISHFYLDFNPIIYNCYHEISENHDFSESLLIEKIIDKLNNMITKVIKVTKLIYIAIDGPVPICKMVKQRERRYKKVYLETIFGTSKWDTSNITPGTEFMDKLCKSIRIFVNTFRKEHNNIRIVFNDSYVPGEGEHKFLKHIESVKIKKEEYICIFSNDADLLMLSNRFPEKQILILMNSQHSVQDFKEIYEDVEFVFIDTNEFRKGLVYELSKHGSGQTYKYSQMVVSRIMYDYIFYNMLAGNDFVQPIYFCKMRKSFTYKVLFSIYNKLLSVGHNHLIYFEGEEPMINNLFFTEFIVELAKQEKFRMKKQHNVLKSYNKRSFISNDIRNNRNELEHMLYSNPEHPYHEQHMQIVNWFNYENDNIWKKQYYLYFFPKETTIDEICEEYLKSLVFTLRYYLNSIPSWNWVYKYKVAPLPSDLIRYINSQKSFDINSYNFGESKMEGLCTPMLQLLYVLPPQSKLLNEDQKKIMNSEKYKYWFPQTFYLDTYSGEKFIYAEPVLPDLDITTLKEMEKDFSEETIRSPLNKLKMLVGTIKKNDTPPLNYYQHNVNLQKEFKYNL